MSELSIDPFHPLMDFMVLIHPQNDRIRFFSLGRHALKAAIELLNIKHEDAVLLPSFICKEVLAPIHECGAQVLFYDIDTRLTPHSLPVDPRIKAVLVVNYFGFPQNIKIFKHYCITNSVALIEDNAHGFLSSDADGISLGTRGDFGIFSYRKTVQIREGASLLLNSPKYSFQDPQLSFNPSVVRASQRIRELLSWIEMHTGIRLVPCVKDLIRKLRMLLTGYAIEPSKPNAEFICPQPENPPEHLLPNLERMDASTEITRRRLLYAQFHQILLSTGIEPVFKSLGQGICPYGYPFYANEATGSEAVKIAQKTGFDCFRWPELPSSIQASAPLHYRQLWVVNFLC